MAALCVGLLAFAAVEQLSPAHASEVCSNATVCATDNGTADPTDVVTADHDAATDSGDPADEQQKPQQRHHCCGAHTNSVPALDQAALPVEMVQSRVLISHHDDPLDRAPLGLERPPKHIAIV